MNETQDALERLLETYFEIEELRAKLLEKQRKISNLVDFFLNEHSENADQTLLVKWRGQNYSVLIESNSFESEPDWYEDTMSVVPLKAI